MKALNIMVMAAGMLCCMTASAFYHDGVNYNIIDQEQALVKVGDNADYGGERLFIPGEFGKDGRTWQVVSIDEKAFAGCEGLVSVSIGNGIREIGFAAFCRCPHLESIHIPETVDDIKGAIMPGSPEVKGITVSYRNRTYSDGNGDCIISRLDGTLIQGCKNTVIPESATAIAEWAFAGCEGLNAIYIPESVRSIGRFAFGGCEALTDIRLGRRGPGQIDWTAFYMCPSFLKMKDGRVACVSVSDELYPWIEEPHIYSNRMFTALLEGQPYETRLDDKVYDKYVSGALTLCQIANDVPFRIPDYEVGRQKGEQTESESQRSGGGGLMSIVWIVAILCLLCPKDKKTWEKEKKEQAAAYEDRRRSSGTTWSYNGRSFRGEADMLEYKNQNCNP